MRNPSCIATGSRYQQHQPEATTLYALVAAHLESFLRAAHEQHQRGLPRYVERELRAYLQCGIHAYGFLRARCSACGAQLLVAFSCKRRGVCPSCNARRMCATAAHLTDHVLPDVPLRQWVLSVPFELRLLLAKDAQALSAVGRIFVREVLRWQVEQARRRLSRTSHTRIQLRGVAICFPQRFGGSLNLNVHYHVAVPDGVFVRQVSSTNRPAAKVDEPSIGTGPPIEFMQLPMPEPSELETISHAVEVRVVRWLRRRGLLTRDGDEHEPSERSAIDACLEGSLGIGELVSLKLADSNPDDELDQPSRNLQQARRAKSKRGFDIHAAVAVTASDREGRERLLRYCARAPLSLERLTVFPDGRIAYRIKAPRGRQTHRVMTPLQFLARLCALIPPPRHPLIRFHGVFAPHSAWRRAVVSLVVHAPGDETKAARIESPDIAETPATEEPAVEGTSKLCSRTGIDWASLLRRVYDLDALACRCGGRLRVIALITERSVATAILDSVGLPSQPPPVARARSPDDHDSAAE